MRSSRNKGVDPAGPVGTLGLSPALIVGVVLAACAFAHVVQSGIWVPEYARLLMPDVEETKTGLRTPPLGTSYGRHASIGEPRRPVLPGDRILSGPAPGQSQERKK
jgi:hypothetical protein